MHCSSSDAAFIVSGFILLSHKEQSAAAVREPIPMFLIGSLFIIPLVNTFVLAVAGVYRPSLMDAAHFVRTANLVMVFLAGFVLAGQESLGRDYVTLSSRFAVVLAMIGVLHYFTPLSVPVYERILRWGALPEGYIDAAWDSWDCFRSHRTADTSVALLSLAGTGRTWHGVALPIVAGINVLMSGSRAGCSVRAWRSHLRGRLAFSSAFPDRPEDGAHSHSGVDCSRDRSHALPAVV